MKFNIRWIDKEPQIAYSTMEAEDRAGLKKKIDDGETGELEIETGTTQPYWEAEKVTVAE